MKTNRPLAARRWWRLALLSCAFHLASAQAQAQAQQFDFRYRVSDARINVFDDGRQTRLQLPEGTPLPVILATHADGQRILSPQRDGLYLVLDGVHAQLMLVWANGREVQAQYQGDMAPERLGRPGSYGPIGPAAAMAPQPSPVPAQSASTADIRSAARVAGQVQAPSLEARPPVAVPQQAPSPAQVPPGTSPEGVQAAAPAPTTFTVRQRESVRETLMRWAQDAGWTFLPEHYTPDFDVQILGDLPAPYVDFRAGVRALLDSTAITGRALQPCFYSNKVLRVVLRTQRCNQL